MRNVILLVVLVVLSAGLQSADAKVFGRRRVTYQSSVVTSDNSSAQAVANWQARNNTMRHIGGNPGYEGVGFSTTSSSDAIRHCCYWGQLRPAQIGVARGSNGWYACVRY